MTRYEIAVFCILVLVFTWSCAVAFVQWAYPTLEDDTDPYADEYPGVSAPRETE
jgi:hypothetical protein